MKFKVLEDNGEPSYIIVESDVVVEFYNCSDEDMEHDDIWELNKDFVHDALGEIASSVANELVKKASNIGITVVPNTFRGKIDWDYDFGKDAVLSDERYYKVWFYAEAPTDEETLKKLNSLDIGYGREVTIDFESYDEETEYVTFSYGTGDTIIKEYRD